jgi:hypothetical protein
MALRVAVRGVDEIAAAFKITAEDRFRLLDGGAPTPVFAEGHGAETERADTQARAAQRDVVGE